MNFIPLNNHCKLDDPEVKRCYKQQNNAGCPCRVTINNYLHCETIIERNTRNEQGIIIVTYCKKCPVCKSTLEG